MKITKIMAFLTVGMMLFLTACEGFLVEEPQAFVTTETFYKTEADAIAAINAVYSSLSQFPTYRGENLIVFDELRTPYSTIGPDPERQLGIEFDLYINTVETGLGLGTWTEMYRGINSANLVLENIPSANLSESFKDRILSLAYLYRGVMYYDLARLFGDVPIILNSTKGSSNRDVSRSPMAEVMAQAESDFKLAAGEGELDGLPVSWSGADSGRPGIHAANAMLARLYLYQKNYQKTIEYTQKIINSGHHSLFDNFRDNFSTALKYAVGKELIFIIDFDNQIDPGTAITRSLNPRRSRLDGSARDARGEWVATQDAWNLFNEVGDVRKAGTFLYSAFDTRANRVVVFDTTSAPYYIYKWRNDQADALFLNTRHAWPIVRYADVLLMHAEALNELNGPTPEAYNAINQVRRRAREDKNNPNHVPDLAGLTQEQFRQEIYEERVRELFFEGHAFTDIIRTNRFEQMMPGVDPKFKLLPIPQLERDLNNNLTQNTGF